jgi:hypothetical protein
MADSYSVVGGQGSAPGAIGPAELDGRAEWVPVGDGTSVLDDLEARLGSEVDLRKVLLAVFCPLRDVLDGPPLEALLAHLPYPLPQEIREGELNLNARVPSPAAVGDYVVDVAELLQHPPYQAAVYVRAAFGAARRALSPEESDGIAARLPRDLADLWRGAR